MKGIACYVAILVIPSTLLAQPEAKAPDEMDKLKFLHGEWQGKGWTQLGPNQKSEFAVTEKAYTKIGGHVLVLEGLGKGKSADGTREIIGHDAFGIVSYDEAGKKYVMRAYRRGGGMIDADLQVGDKSFEWGFKDPQRNVQVRFAMKINEMGQWYETGEVSRDGTTWHKFMEMTLTRAK